MTRARVFIGGEGLSVAKRGADGDLTLNKRSLEMKFIASLSGKSQLQANILSRHGGGPKTIPHWVHLDPV